ncbi:MAG: InlB B-repeat-containing protein, partial [Oscillospiraceae bacterium]
AGGNRITIIMNPQGGSGGTLEINVENGTKMPTIDPPTRWGYDFAGYWSAASKQGKQYYNAQGAPTVTNCDFTQNTALYAHWTIKTMGITYLNMEGATPGASAPISHTYGANTTVPNPTKPSYTFFGWQVNDSTVASQGLVLGAAAYNADITLNAVWNKAALVTLVNSTAETVTMLDGDLRNVFNHQVTDPTAGVTIDDLNSEEVKLTLTAKDADNLAEGAADIIKLAQGEVLKFYDFSISKTVKKLNVNPVITNLNELPNTVQVEITLGNSLKGSSAYRVYRYHGGKAEAIPHGPITDPTDRRESFELSPDGTKLILHTRRLSTYAVVGSEKALGGSGTIERGEAGLDVQAQVLEGGSGPVYKIDIKFGKMYFTYSTGRTWDPDAHRYTDVRIYDWIPDACYTGGNNEVTVFNHSNADVSVGFAVNPILKAGASESLLNGVDMVMKNENRADGTPAQNVFLSKVPVEGATAPFINAYLRLNGSPIDPEFYKGLVTNAEGYVQIADITVIIGYLGGPRTPKK